MDCTNLAHETDLFGSWPPYQGWEKDSVVNNHLASHNGQRCIVFMEEFEKTKDEVREALLVPFNNSGWHLQTMFYSPFITYIYGFRGVSRPAEPCHSQLLQHYLGSCNERL